MSQNQQENQRVSLVRKEKADRRDLKVGGSRVPRERGCSVSPLCQPSL